jgi:hypothetical protein
VSTRFAAPAVASIVIGVILTACYLLIALSAIVYYRLRAFSKG